MTCHFSIIHAQNNQENAIKTLSDTAVLKDTLSNNMLSDTVVLEDTLSNNTVADTTVSQDTTNLQTADTLSQALPLSPNAVTSIVDYYAEDSLTFDITNSIALLYHEVDLNYEDVNLKADHVEISFSANELFAKGSVDTAEVLQGTPVFKQGSYEVKSHELHYNFDSKKGLLRNVITQEGESYLHGEIVKKNDDNTSYIRHGKYTTCNLESPHFEIGFGKAKVIPSDKIITGPFWIRIASIPLIPFPFGFFPNSDKHTNGLIMPMYGIKADKGPYLEGIGYYFALKDKIDFAVTATLYMRGSFGAGLRSNYIKRYKYNGNYDINYSFTPTGEKHTKQYAVTHDMKIYWQHQQDRKAHPVNSFSANIDFKTGSYSKNNVEENLSSQIQSKAMSVVNFSTAFGSKFSLGVNAELSQDLVLGNLDMKLPQINFGVSQFYPFRRKQVVGKMRWYENISMQYTMNVQNIVNTYDSILFKDFARAFDNYLLGVSHSIPIKSTIKLFKHISWTNSVSLTETWQIKGVRQSWGTYDSLTGSHIRRDTITKFFAGHDLSLSSGLSTTLYGMYTLKKGRVSAFRHTLTPSVYFDYRPAINNSLYDVYYDVQQNKDIQYSYVSGFVYGAPSNRASGRINFSVSNKLEMKVRSRKEEDESSYKKVMLLENLSISTSYDCFADSLRWSPLSVNGRTTLFKYINIAFSLMFDPYIIDTNGIRVNKTEFREHKRLFRLSSSSADLSFGLNINRDFFKRKNGDQKKEDKEEKKASPSGFGEWNINVNYIFNYNSIDNRTYYLLQRYSDTLIPRYTHRFQNSLTLTGSIAITSKWTLNFTSGYNFTEKSISASEFSIERDLHCFTLHFRWVPFGSYRSFEFGIRAKANILRDVKWDQTKYLENL
ncbi:MAG: hypothetical protein LBQ64_00675 [Bacteroidales bacterium]|nr:hypothetical protein [Bacteroidales bacterium]